MRPASQRFFIHSCIYLRILIMPYLATFLGTNSFSVLMCRKAVDQSINQSINQSITVLLRTWFKKRHMLHNKDVTVRTPLSAVNVKPLSMFRCRNTCIYIKRREKTTVCVHVTRHITLSLMRSSRSLWHACSKSAQGNT